MEEQKEPKLIEVNCGEFKIRVFYIKGLKPETEVIQEIIEELKKLGEKEIDDSIFIFKKIEEKERKRYYECNIVIRRQIRYTFTLEYDLESKKLLEKTYKKIEE